ncbi:MAG: hypothetical protein ABFS34_04965 [Gemmatimonadota bacterium]
MSKTSRRLSTLLLLAVSVAACDGAIEPEGVPAAPRGVSAEILPSLAGNRVTIAWEAVPGATSYRVDVGSAPGLSDLGSLGDVAEPTAEMDLVVGEAFIQVGADNEFGSGPASAPVVVHSLDLRDVVQALYLGSGPLCEMADGACVTFSGGRFKGFPLGTHVTVRISTTLGDEAIAAVVESLEQVEDATLGQVTVEWSVTEDPDPIPGLDEVTGTRHPDPQSVGCPFERGCTIHQFRTFPVLASSRAVQKISSIQAFPHDIVGHGILGMNHIEGPIASLMGGPPPVFAGALFPRLSPYDAAAARAVYASGVEPGAGRATFQSLGLVK